MKTARSIVTRGALAGWLALVLIVSAAEPGVFASAPATNTTQQYGGLTTDQGLASSTAVVAHSGTGVNLRAQPDHAAPILATLPDGTTVTLRVDQVDTVYDPDGVTRWWPVSYKGQDGWIAGFYLAPPGSSASSSNTSNTSSSANTSNTSNASTPTASTGGLTEDQLTGNSVKVANSANGVNMRSKPDSRSSVLDKLPEDTVVTLRIDQVNTVYDSSGIHWWPVSYNGQDGWIGGQYLAPTTSSASPAPSPSPSPGSSASPSASPTAGGLTEDQLTGNSVKVANSANGVNLRAKPDGSSAVLDKLPIDTVVTLRIDQVNTVYDSSGIHWWPVSYNGQDGWIDGQYLAPTSSSASPSPSPSSASQAKFTSGEYVAAKTPSGRGVVIRADPAPAADKVGSIAEGDVVQIMSGPTYDSAGDAWYKVTNGGVTGYADGSLFVPAPQPSPPASPSPSPSPTTTATTTPSVTKEPANFAQGDYAQAKTQLGIGVNIHANPSITSTVVGSVAETGIVQMESGPIYDSQGNVWYQVTNNGVAGYVNGTLFVAASAPAASPAPSQQPAAQTAPATSSSMFIYPLANYTITQGYGCTGFTLEPYNAALGCYFHNAIDLAAPQGTPIMAAAAGTVVTAGWCDCGLGYMVEIDHGNGFHTVYGHMMQQPSVSVGQQVSQGQLIGYVGSTGDSTGPHTHFEILLNGNTVNPLDYLP